MSLNRARWSWWPRTLGEVSLGESSGPGSGHSPTPPRFSTGAEALGFWELSGLGHRSSAEGWGGGEMLDGLEALSASPTCGGTQCAVAEVLVAFITSKGEVDLSQGLAPS